MGVPINKSDSNSETITLENEAAISAAKKTARLSATSIRWRNWEYWSSHAFYFPMYIWGPLLALRAGHPAFFTAANPGIHTGGFGFESKYDTLMKIPEDYRPKTILASASEDFQLVLRKMQRADIHFPLICKPDVGFRGFLVRKIETEQELAAYLRKYPVDFIIQEFVWRANEFGVLYYRMPGEQKGKITSLTLKEFLSVIGDGKSTVLALVKQHPRALLQLERLRDTHAHLLHNIPAKGERVSLGTIGNHSKGTRFINGNHKIDHQLERTFDKVADQIDGFNYGRFDIKCDSLESLKRGEDITIFELNGTCSEPAHIYDPERSTYLSALRDIMWHWWLIHKIAIANRKRGAKFLPAMEMIQIIRQTLKRVKYLKSLA